MADNESNKIPPWFDNPHSTESISSGGVMRCAGDGMVNQRRTDPLIAAHERMVLDRNAS
jgi:hypothetical protein